MRKVHQLAEALWRNPGLKLENDDAHLLIRRLSFTRNQSPTLLRPFANELLVIGGKLGSLLTVGNLSAYEIELLNTFIRDLKNLPPDSSLAGRMARGAMAVTTARIEL